MELAEQTVSSALVYSGRFLKVYRDEARLPDGAAAVREVVRHPGSVVVVPVDEAGNVHLVRQYRYPCARVLLEVPAGKLEPGEEAQEAAARELLEETGARAEEWLPLGRLLPTPGFCDEVQYIYLARGLHVGKARPDEDEFLEQVVMPMDEACAMALDGRIEDAKTVAALLRARYREGE